MPVIGRRYSRGGYRRRRYRPSSYRRQPYRRSRRVVRRRPRGYTLYSTPRVGYQRSAPFPNRATAKLVFRDSGYDMSTAVGTGYITRHVFRANSIYDPDYTAAGVQPYWHDILQTIYTRYRVNACKITLWFSTSTPTGTTEEIKCCVFPSNSASDPSNQEFVDLAALPCCKQVSWNQASIGNRGKTKLQLYRTTRQGAGLSNSRDQDLSAVFGQNPTATWYYHVYSNTVDVAATTTILMDVKITYYCTFWQRLSVNES